MRKRSTGSNSTPPKAKVGAKPRPVRKPAVTGISGEKSSRKTGKTRVSATEVTSSPSFLKATSKAESYAKDPKRLKKLFQEASKKAEGVPHGAFSETWAYLMSMLRLIRAYYSSDYRNINWQSFLIIVAAVIYFVTPFDLIPDWIPLAGYIDDVFVVGLALKSVRGDLDAFMAWETSKG